MKISDELDVSAYYLMDLTDNPIPPKEKILTEEEKLAAEIFKMSPKKREQLIEYTNFLKTQEEFSQELSETLDTIGKKPLTE